MLGEALQAQPPADAPDHVKAHCAELDRQIMSRITEVRAYLSRLAVGESQIN